MAKKILVTGALGHIGSRLIRNFEPHLAREVLLMDNLSTQRYASLFSLPSGFRYRFFEEDILTTDFSKYLKGVDAVIHLAALTDAMRSAGRDADYYMAVNLNGLKRVAQACLKSGAALVYPSTTSVYGSQLSVVDETCRDLKPQSPYAVSKLRGEQYLQGLRSKGLKFVICRFGTIFGHSIGMRFHTAVNKFVWQAVNGLPLTVWKTAWKQKRPYLDLDDCVRAVNFILDRRVFDREVYNILTDNFTVGEIVNVIKSYLPRLKVGYVDSPIMNQLSYEVDDAKFRKLGFLPKGDLRRSIRHTINQMRGINSINIDI